MSKSTATTVPEGRIDRHRPGARRYLWAAGLLALLGLGIPYGAGHGFGLGLPPPVLPEASTLVLDRSGQLLKAFTTRAGRWSLPLDLKAVDPRFIAMLVACEDKRFYEHGGIDALAALRAAGQMLLRRRIVSGASTLTMQVARLIEPRHARAFGPKLRQMLRALALERRFDKAGILDLYLRLAPYGGNLQGVRAASLAYFGHEPKRLALAEAALLVALPQSPERRRPDRFPAAARAARNLVLDRAAARGLITPEAAAAAKAEPVPRLRRALPDLAPHAAEEAHAADPQAPVLRLTLDAHLQRSLEALVRTNAARFGPDMSGALLVVDNASGEIRAHVGSADRASARRAGALDMTRALRSPGSALKPFIYALAFENGIAAPDTVLEDRPTHYGAYAPENFDQGFRGSVSARHALQWSLNLPAIALLDQVGPARFLARLRDAGAEVALSDEAAPGLAVGLGGLGIRLIDLARLYAGFARGGTPPALRERLDRPAPAAYGRPVAEPIAAWQIAGILRGAPPPPNALGGRIAFKTGTSYGYRDAVAIGFSRKYTVAAWLGRPDNGAVPGLVGRQAAAPMLFDAFARLGGSLDPPPAPPGAALAASGTLSVALQHLRDRQGLPMPRLRIAYPPDGATVDLGLDGKPQPLDLEVEGGVPPFSWFVNNVPAGAASLRRRDAWIPDGAGFARISVTDRNGSTDSIAVRLR